MYSLKNKSNELNLVYSITKMVVKEHLNFFRRKKNIEMCFLSQQSSQTSASLTISTEPSQISSTFSSEKLSLIDIIAIGLACSLNGKIKLTSKIAYRTWNSEI